MKTNSEIAERLKNVYVYHVFRYSETASVIIISYFPNEELI